MKYATEHRRVPAHLRRGLTGVLLSTAALMLTHCASNGGEPEIDDALANASLDDNVESNPTASPNVAPSSNGSELFTNNASAPTGNGSNAKANADVLEMESLLQANGTGSGANSAGVSANGLGLTENSLPVNGQDTLSNAAVLAPGQNVATDYAPRAGQSVTSVPQLAATGAKSFVQWIGYDFSSEKRQVIVTIKTKGSPAYSFKEETNQSGQRELAVMFKNSRPEPAMRWPMDASEFRSPVAFLRTRVTADDTIIILTLREPLQPSLNAEPNIVALTYDVPAFYFTGDKSGYVASSSVLPSNWSDSSAIVAVPTVVPIAPSENATMQSNGTQPLQPILPMARFVDPAVSYEGNIFPESTASTPDSSLEGQPATVMPGTAPSLNGVPPNQNSTEESLDDFDDGTGEAPTSGEKFEL